MNSILLHQIRSLTRQLAHFEDDARPAINYDFISRTRPWNPVHLFTQLMIFAERPAPISIEKLDEWEKELQKQRGLIVSLKSLIDKHWIRIVMGQIALPTAIRYSITVFDQLKQDFTLIRFLYWAGKKIGPQPTEQDFTLAVKEYEEAQGISIDLTSDIAIKNFHVKDAKVSITSPQFLEPFVKNENEFHFLSFIGEKIGLACEDGAYVDLVVINRILDEHRQIYPSTPKKEDFIQEGVFKINGDRVQLALLSYWEYYGHEISAALALIHFDGINFPERWFQLLFTQSWSRSNELFVPNELNQIILQRLCNIILFEGDLAPVDSEVDKARLDADRDSHLLDSNLFKDRDYRLEAGDSIYELSWKMNLIAERSNSNIFHSQSTRSNLLEPLRLIFANDGKGNSSMFEFAKSIVSAGAVRPYILSEAPGIILWHRREVLPYLIGDLSLSNYGLFILSQLKIPTNLTPLESNEEIKKKDLLEELWRTAFNIYIGAISHELSKPTPAIERVVEIIFETLLMICRLRYHREDGYKYYLLFKQSEELLTGCNKLGNVILNDQNGLKVLKGLADRYVNSPELVCERVVRIPLDRLQIGLLISDWISSSTSLDKIESSRIADSIGKVLARVFVADVATFREHIWGDQSSLNIFPWSKLFIFLKRTGREKQLLFDPYIVFQEGELTKDIKYVRVNRSTSFQVNRIRTFFSVVSEVFRGLPEHDSVLRRKVSDFYEELIFRFSSDDMAQGLLNVFHLDFDSNTYAPRKSLLPDLIYDLNYFDSQVKRKLVQILSERLTLGQLIRVWYDLAGEGDKDSLRNIIGTKDLSELQIERSREASTAIAMLAWQNEFPDKIREYIDRIQNHPNADSESLLFQLKLYEFYHKSDLSGIRTLQVPSKETHGVTETDYRSEQRLFEALILGKEQRYGEAISVMSELSKQKAKFVYAINLFIWRLSEAKLIKNEENKTERLVSILKSWQEELTKHESREIELYQSSAWLYHLSILDELGYDNSFEQLYSEVRLPERMVPEILSLRVKNLVRRNRISEANDLYIAAFKFHGGQINRSGFLQEMERMITSPAQLNQLAKNFDHILSKDALDQIKTLPSSINPNNQSMEDFVTFEVEWCLLELIKRVRSLSSLHGETKYNDVLASMLSARVSAYAWSIKDGASGNKSASGKDPGKRDIIIEKNGRDIAIIECVHLHSVTDSYVQTHIAKVFTYSESKIPRFILGYYLGPPEKFSDCWTYYSQNIFPGTDLAPEYKQKSALEELTTNSVGIKKARSAHGDGFTLTHIVVNLNLMA